MSLFRQRGLSTLGIVLLVVLLMFLFGALPLWPHAANWGYFPPGVIGVLLIIAIVLLITGKL
jgi:hypothetical protein